MALVQDMTCFLTRRLPSYRFVLSYRTSLMRLMCVCAEAVDFNFNLTSTFWNRDHKNLCDSNVDLRCLICFMKLHDWPWMPVFTRGASCRLSITSVQSNTLIYIQSWGECALRLIIKATFFFGSLGLLIRQISQECVKMKKKSSNLNLDSVNVEFRSEGIS